MKERHTTTMAIWIVLVLVGATGLGYGIRHIRWSVAASKSTPAPEPGTPVVDSELEIETAPEPAPEPDIEIVGTRQIVVEEPAVEEPEEELQPEVAAEPHREPWQFGQNAGLIRKFFEDLNLNEEEQARLRQGIELMRRQFEQMSDEERWYQFAQMAEMGQRWNNMSDQERQAVTQRMRERYEEWRHSDSVELPQLTLD